MNEKQLQVLANELAKNLKTPDDLSQFDHLLKIISVEAAINAVMAHHLGYDKIATRKCAETSMGIRLPPLIPMLKHHPLRLIPFLPHHPDRK